METRPPVFLIGRKTHQAWINSKSDPRNLDRSAFEEGALRPLNKIGPVANSFILTQKTPLPKRVIDLVDLGV